MSLSIQGKQLTVYVNDKVWDFKQKFELWKTIHHTEVDNFHILKHFSKIGSDISKYDFVILYNEMCPHLDDLYKSLN